jgi:hypothetical protein
VAGINRQPNILEKYELQKDAGAKKLAESIASGFLNSLPGYSFKFSPIFHEHLQVRWVERSSDDASHRTYALEIEMPEISKGKLKESHGIKASKDVPALKWFSDRDLRAGDGPGLIHIERQVEGPKVEGDETSGTDDNLTIATRDRAEMDISVDPGSCDWSDVPTEAPPEYTESPSRSATPTHLSNMQSGMFGTVSKDAWSGNAQAHPKR